MYRCSGFLVLLAVLSGGSALHAAFDDDFTGATLRIDYDHVGTSDEEHFALERMRIEGPWPGSRTRLLDDSNLGQYLVEIVDLASNRPLYTRGFASIYGEWETTGEARRAWRSIPEAVRIPEPRRKFQLRIRKRGNDRSFHEVWSLAVDPSSRFVDRPPTSSSREVRVLLENGDPSIKVDLLVLGDGYTQSQQSKFHDDAKRLTAALFDEEPFLSRRSDFNVRAIGSAAERSGISRPRAGVFRDTPLSTRYNSFDSERYVLTLDDRGWRDRAAVAPYDFVLILINERKYGGGGIHNLYATATVGSGFASYLAVHEFGHHFAALADEYYTSPVAYEEPAGERIEPWEPNVTALREPHRLKWGDLVSSDTPLPTPWNKAEFEKKSRAIQERRKKLRESGAPEEELEALFREEKELFTGMLADEKHAGRIGAFEGAMYQARGLYRPSADCIMFSRNDVGFCSVCRRAIERVIDLYSE